MITKEKEKLREMESRGPKRKGKENWREEIRNETRQIKCSELNKHGWTQAERAPRVANSRNTEKSIPIWGDTEPMKEKRRSREREGT